MLWQDVATPSMECAAVTPPLSTVSKNEFATSAAYSKRSIMFKPAVAIASNLLLIWSTSEKVAVRFHATKITPYLKVFFIFRHSAKSSFSLSESCSRATAARSSCISLSARSFLFMDGMNSVSSASGPSPLQSGTLKYRGSNAGQLPPPCPLEYPARRT